MSKSTAKNGHVKKPAANKKKQLKQDVLDMQVIRPDAAGIDIADRLHAVAVPAGRDKEPVRALGAFTCHLQAIVRWLKRCNINSVAMESTGVDRKPL